jgi:DNA-binding protein Fis
MGPSGSLLLKDAEQAHILAVLDYVKGNKRRAARELGIARATLERKLADIERDQRKRAK